MAKKTTPDIHPIFQSALGLDFAFHYALEEYHIQQTLNNVSKSPDHNLNNEDTANNQSNLLGKNITYHE